VRKPTVWFYRMERDIAIDGVGTTQGQCRHLAEQDCDLAEDIVEAERSDQHSDRNKPKREPECAGAKQATRGRSGVIRQVILTDAFSGRPHERAVDSWGMGLTKNCWKPDKCSAEANQRGANDDGHER